MSRALVISQEYDSIPTVKLSGCHYDADNFISTLRRIEPDVEVIIMRDNLPQTSELYPNKTNIIKQIVKLTMASEKKLFFYYSGHGTSVTDYNKDESRLVKSNVSNKFLKLESALKDSCLVTNENTQLNIITDDQLNTILRGLPADRTLYAFLDCCNSGTGFDLQYVTLGNYTGRFLNTVDDKDKLVAEVESKCEYLETQYSILNSTKIKANVILITGTKDIDYAYESTENGVTSGHFTTALCKLLNNDVSQMTLRKFYLLLVGCINNPKQIPVLSCSKYVNTNDLKLNDFSIKQVKSKLSTEYLFAKYRVQLAKSAK